MTAFLKPPEGRIYAGFRIITGFLFLQHGLQKCFGMLGGHQADNLQMWVAGSIELLGGTAIAIGFQARWAAFVASGMMAVAYFMVHAPNGFWTVANRGEPAVLYCWAFLLIATRGSGIWSVDAATGRS